MTYVANIVAEAATHGMCIGHPSDLHEQYITLANRKVWRLSDSEWDSLYDCLTRLFHLLAS